MNQKDQFENNNNQNSNWVANQWLQLVSKWIISSNIGVSKEKKMNFKMNLMYEVGMEKKSNLKYKF